MDVGERYLELALRLGRLAPHLVESYCGPAGIAERVRSEREPTIAAVHDDAARLRADVGSRVADRSRRRWLEAQLAGVEAACAVLAGERIAYERLVERCHGVRPRRAPEERFAVAHARLEEALPGGGTLPERYQRWRAAQAVDPRRLAAGLHALADELRARARAAFGLPDGEAVDFELVSGRSWAGHARYRGGLRSTIGINTDLPIPASRLLELVAHEAYPGHHTEHCIKEAVLIRGAGHAEHAVFLYPTPQALVSEGIAQLGLEQLLGADAERVAAVVLDAVGIDLDVQTAAVVREVKEALGPVRTNVAMLLDEPALSRAEIGAYARRWMLEPDSDVERAVEAVAARPWRPYESCYPEGLAVCRAFADRAPGAFRRLLAEPLTTADLRREPPPRGWSASAARRSHGSK